MSGGYLSFTFDDIRSEYADFFHKVVEALQPEWILPRSSARYEIRILPLMSEQVEDCAYQGMAGSGTVRRAKMDIKLEIFDLEKRQSVDHRIFVGGLPDKCPHTIVGYSSLIHQYGKPPSASDVTQWLSGSVAKLGFDMQSMAAPNTSAVPIPAPQSGVQERIAFATDRDGDSEIYIINIDGSDATNLTRNPARDFAPDWSPDGTRIAFTSNRTGNNEIWIMNADGSQPTQLTNNPASDIDPSWSPEGTMIAFSSDRDIARLIYVMRANGVGQTPITSVSGISGDSSPDWSPDGRSIVFHSERECQGFGIYAVRVDNSEVTQLSCALDVSPSWSPDGTRIALEDVNTVGGILLMNADGTGRTQLLQGVGTNVYENPAWSSDGKRLAYSSGRGGDFEIYILNLEDSRQIRVTNSKGWDPSWQP